MFMRNLRRTATRFSLLAVGLTAAVSIGAYSTSHALGAPPTVLLEDGRIAIDSLPFVISNCGSYVVRGCHSGVAGSDGISIAASDVTVDLNGNTLLGVEMSGAGIAVTPGLRNIRILNGGLRGWRNGGINATGVSYVIVSDVRATENDGAGISAGQGAQLQQCVASGNRGSGFDVGPSSRVSDCSAIENLGEGMSAADGSVIATSVAGSNKLNGFQVSGIMNACVAEANNRHGIAIENGGAYACSANANRRDGFHADNNALVRDCSSTTGEASLPNAVAYRLGSDCMLGESRGNVNLGQFALRLAGNRSFAERCNLTTDAPGAMRPAVDWLTERNFVGDSLFGGFISMQTGAPSLNVWGDTETPPAGETNNFSKFGSLLMFYQP